MAKTAAEPHPDVDRDPRARGKERLLQMGTGGALLALTTALYGLIGLAVWAIWHARRLILG